MIKLFYDSKFAMCNLLICLPSLVQKYIGDSIGSKLCAVKVWMAMKNPGF
jgi:hypothetical protein